MPTNTWGHTSLVAQTVKSSAYNAGDPDSIPGSGRSLGEGNANSLQYSCLENPMEEGARYTTVHGVAKSRTWLNDWTELNCTLFIDYQFQFGFPHSSIGKSSACNAGDLGSIPGLGRSPGEVNGNPLQYSFLENPMDRRAWQATVHRIMSRTQLGN